MTIRATVSIIVIFFLYGCETVVKEYDIEKLNYDKNSFIKDSLILNSLIINNEEISGWKEYEKIPVIIEEPGSGHSRAFTKNDLSNRIYKYEHSKFYIIDTVHFTPNYGIVILRKEKVYSKSNNSETLFLSLFNKDNKNIRTYTVALDIAMGIEVVSGREYMKSELTNKNILITYTLNDSFLDCSDPPYTMDSIIAKYNLMNGEIISIDTVKSIKPKAIH